MASSKPNKEFTRVLHELELEQQRLRETRNQLQIRNNQLDAAEKRCADLERQVSLSSIEGQAQREKIPPEIQYVVLEKHLTDNTRAGVMNKAMKAEKEHSNQIALAYEKDLQKSRELYKSQWQKYEEELDSLTLKCCDLASSYEKRGQGLEKAKADLAKVTELRRKGLENMVIQTKCQDQEYEKLSKEYHEQIKSKDQEYDKLSKEHHELKQKYDHQVIERNDMAAKWTTRAPSLEVQQLFDALEQKVAKVESIGEAKDKMMIQKTQSYDRLEQTHVEMILHHKYEQQQWERTKSDLEKAINLDVERYKSLREASCAVIKAQAEHMDILRADLAIQTSFSETKSAISKS